MSKALTDIRKKIDTLDNKIHDVLMERAALIDQVIAEKRKQNLPFVHPAREAQMIRRLLERHSGPLPKEAIVRIWRELVGAVCLMQTGLRVSVCTGEDTNTPLWEISRNYFGSVVPMNRLSNALLAIGSVREDESSFAVMPWPEDRSEEKDEPVWWVHLFHQDVTLNIVCALPYGQTERPGRSEPDQALVVSKTDFMPSGNDHSFVMFELQSDVSRARVVDVLKSCDLEPLSIYNKASAEEGRMFHLVEVKDYVVAGDTRLDSAKDQFEDHKIKIKPMGGYPVAPVYKTEETVC